MDMQNYVNLGNNIRELMTELGVPCIQKDVQESPSYITFHYNLIDINQLGQVEKKIKFLSAFIHKDITYKKSDKFHFALAVPKEGRNKVDFYDKKFDNLFDRENKMYDMFVGVDDNGNPVTINIDDMPHILVAGTTGSGKSVAINTLICSLLRNSNSLRIDFVMIDTKRVELSLYRELTEDLCQVATDFNEAIQLLDGVCDHIDLVYKFMEEKKLKKSPPEFGKKVVVIEELNDLMIVSKKAVEKYIVKIAQLGRACGVHLIIATQRPAVETVTGAIKANIGCRLALQTTSSVDSRNILGHKGAESLRGKGDGLLKLPTTADEIHIQCPFITDEEINKTIKDFLEE